MTEQMIDEGSTALDTTCACGAPKPSAYRSGCDVCEEEARTLWAAAIEPPKLPAGWVRRYEPVWDCSPYFIYTRAEPFISEKDFHPSNANDFSGVPRETYGRNYFGACKSGITTPTFGEHLYSGEAPDVLAIMTIAYAEHRLLRDFEENWFDDAVAKVGRVRARERLLRAGGAS